MHILLVPQHPALASPLLTAVQFGGGRKGEEEREEEMGVQVEGRRGSGKAERGTRW